MAFNFCIFFLFHFKIYSAKVDYDFSNPLIHIYDSIQKQNFEFTSTVSWTFMHPEKLVKCPPKPRLLFKVPSNFFYHF